LASNIFWAIHFTKLFERESLPMSPLSDSNILNTSDHFSLSPMILNELEKHYLARSGYVTQYLKGFSETYHLDLSDVHSIQMLFAQLNPVQSMHFTYDVSTNLRGNTIYQKLEPFFKPSYKRFLDVGCGHGGYVNAFANHGFESVGLELVSQRYNYAKLNCGDYGQNRKVFQKDILKLNTSELAELGLFDVITCNDVLEHVLDPELAIQKLNALLAPGGFLYIEVPNKDAITFVQADGHYKMFGITLLDHYVAARYYEELKTFEGDPENTYHAMGEYYPMGYYLDQLESMGLNVATTTNFVELGKTFDEVPQRLAVLSVKFADWYHRQRLNHSHFVGERLIENYMRYLETLTHDYNQARYHGKRQEFVLKYIAEFWNFVAIKPETGNCF
jgi:2-polyprenyl-3-methyl-5-hydroxy-6-metoxy-1,4-benzoquinol methylase